jgi:hypothetical protein
MRDSVTVRTDFRVRKWDEDQTRWARRRLGLRYDADVTPREFAMAGPGGVAPYSDFTDYDCNLVVKNGWIALLGGIAGTSITTKFSASAGRIGVGTSSTAATYADTWLGGDTGVSSTTSYYKLVSGAPVIATTTSPPTLTFSATFGTAVANFAWAEFGTDNFTADGVQLNGLGGTTIFFNHGISNQGTKVSGQTWTATETVSFGFPSGSGTVS